MVSICMFISLSLCVSQLHTSPRAKAPETPQHFSLSPPKPPFSKRRSKSRTRFLSSTLLPFLV